MSDNSKIEWTDATFNPWIGCQHVSPGCDHCYAETQNSFRRWNEGGWGPRAPRKRTSSSYWRQPLKWNEQAKSEGIRKRVFCASLADIFDNQAPPGARADLFDLIRTTPHLDWLLLTKRPENIASMLPSCWGNSGWPNVWLGTTCEDQQRADHRIPILLDTPATVRFISAEPLLGPIDLTRVKAPTDPEDPESEWLFDALAVGDIYEHRTVDVMGDAHYDAGDGPYREAKLDWVIVGGESGPHARPMHPNWARKIRDDCDATGVAFFFKQYGEYAVRQTDQHRDREHIFLARDWDFVRLGKKRAGRLLDGVEHNAFPIPR